VPLVAARAAAGAAEPLRASLASTSTAPSVVVARRAVTPLVPLEAPPGAGGTAQVTAPTTGRSAGEAAPVIARPLASAQREADGATGAGGSRGSAPLGAGARLAVQLAGTAIGGVRTSSADQPGGPGWSGVAASADGGASPGARSDLVLPVVARLAADAAPSAATPGPALGWTADRGFGPLPAGAGPVVQRVVEVGEVAAQVEPGSQSGGTGTGAGAGSGSGPDYEEIAEHVYDRIRSRIALELLLDRERMGLLIDG
jgi:hypothetical protein